MSITTQESEETPSSRSILGRMLKPLLSIAFAALAVFAVPTAAQAATHIVQPGEWVSTIAPRYGIPWERLCSHNQLPNCNNIYVGQALDVPTTQVAGASVSRSVAPAQSAPAGVPGLYTALQSGYVWGGNQPGGFDCSGLTQWLAAQRGVSIPRNSYGQMTGLRAIGPGELRPGDVVVMNGGGHVGMYIGGNQLVHALNPAQGIRIENLSVALQYNPLVGYRAVGH